MGEQINMPKIGNEPTKTIKNVASNKIAQDGIENESYFELDCKKSFSAEKPFICSMEFSTKACEFFHNDLAFAEVKMNMLLKLAQMIPDLSSPLARSLEYTKIASSMMDAGMKDVAIHNFKLAYQEWQKIDDPKEAKDAGTPLILTLNRYGISKEIIPAKL